MPESMAAAPRVWPQTPPEACVSKAQVTTAWAGLRSYWCSDAVGLLELE